LIDGEGFGAGASGNPLALVAPRLDAADGPQARALVAAWLRALHAWPLLGADAVQALPIRDLPRGDAERQRFERLLADPPLEPPLLAPLDPADAGAGLLLNSLAVRPSRALAELAAGAHPRFGDDVSAMFETPDGAQLRLASGDTIEADLAVVCAGMG